MWSSFCFWEKKEHQWITPISIGVHDHKVVVVVEGSHGLFLNVMDTVQFSLSLQERVCF